MVSSAGIPLTSLVTCLPAVNERRGFPRGLRRVWGGSCFIADRHSEGWSYTGSTGTLRVPAHRGGSAFNLSARPAARMLIAALWSRSWVAPHGQVHLRTFSGILRRRPTVDHSPVRRAATTARLSARPQPYCLSRERLSPGSSPGLAPIEVRSLMAVLLSGPDSSGVAALGPSVGTCPDPRPLRRCGFSTSPTSSPTRARGCWSASEPTSSGSTPTGTSTPRSVCTGMRASGGCGCRRAS